VLFAVMMVRMTIVIIPDRVSVMFCKSEGNRCWNGYSHTGLDDERSFVRTLIPTVSMYNAP